MSLEIQYFLFISVSIINSNITNFNKILETGNSCPICEKKSNQYLQKCKIKKFKIDFVLGKNIPFFSNIYTIIHVDIRIRNLQSKTNFLK